MPRGDRMGPLGQGQMTGRQRGYCAGYEVPGYVQGGAYGCGCGRGRAQTGRGMTFRQGGGRGGWLSESTVEPLTNEAVQLKDRIGQLERTLEALRRRLETLGGEARD